MTQCMMHRTQSVDYGIVTLGEVVAKLSVSPPVMSFVTFLVYDQLRGRRDNLSLVRTRVQF